MNNFKKLDERGKAAIYSMVVLALAIGGLIYGVGLNQVVAKSKDERSVARPTSPTAVFAANAPTLGAIPDAVLSGCNDADPPTSRDVTFTVTGIPGSPSAVGVDMTFGSPIHTWMADIKAVLIAPNGANHVIFGRTGATTATGCGDSSTLAGPYEFSDAASSPPSGGWWQAAIATAAGSAVPSGLYRSTAVGGAGATSPAPATTINTAFAAIPTSNGTWTLRLTDHGQGDTGAVSAANLTLTAAGPATASAPVDFNGDGKTDYSVVRNTGGGPSGEVTWYACTNGQAEPACWNFFVWGLASDFFVPEDYDGDNKTDIAVWRPGAATVAAFYIFQSQTSTLRIEYFGQSGDDPSVVGDYDGDNKADVAVFRNGINPGDQSVWYYRTSQSGPVSFVPWGSTGDFPAPGDYDGDGKNDFVIQRNDGGGQARFWRQFATGGTDTINFGTPTDLIVPGDYDGDGKTDVAVARGVGGNISWFVVPSSTGVISAAPYAVFGTSSTDYVVQGDYDGDGKTDVAIWRPNVDSTQNFFYTLGSTAGLGRFEWGATGDYPTANFNSH